LDTIIDLTVYSQNNPAKIMDSVQHGILHIDSMLSISNTSSDIYNINHRTSDTVHVPPLVMSIIEFCTRECDSSSGLFDITVAPLKYIYGLESHQHEHLVPSSRQLDSMKQFIGCSKIHRINDSTLYLNKGVTLDLGGIGKGYICNYVNTLFTHAGYYNFLINFGGDIFAAGSKPGKNPWIIGIKHPRDTLRLMAILPALSSCVFTSGDYERFFMEKGVRYHHLFDPHTALPARKNQSATAICNDPVVADVSVKIAFMMTADNALAYLEKRNITGIIVDSVGTIFASKALQNLIKPDSGIIIQFK
jgi:thiamine biosynthesis lipoprotein